MNNNAINNANINNNSKEEKKMSRKSNNDYTLGGRIESQSWTEFVAVCRSHGINCGGKKFVVLKAELETLLAEKEAIPAVTPATIDVAPVVIDVTPVVEPIPVVAPVVIPEAKGEFILTKKMGDAIARRIMYGGIDRNGKAHGPAMFKVTKSKDPEVNGKLMVTMSKLYGIIADVYGLSNDAAKREKNDAFIKKGVINYLCRHGWLAFKKYESGGISFFPTQKMLTLKF